MSTNSNLSNVIAMRDFEREAPSSQAIQFDNLLKECREVALDRLSKSMNAMLDKLPDLNVPPASSVQDRDSRDLFVKAKISATSQRNAMQEHFYACLLAEFEASSRGGKATSDFSQKELSSLELSLVDENDFEETLRVNEMAAKLRRYCDEEVVALDQRIGVLIGDATLQGQANPLSPQAICSAYKQACRGIEPESKVRLMLLKLFDDHVLDDIRSIYKDLNALLIERSILPKIRYGATRRTSALGAFPRGHSADAEPLADPITSAQEPAEHDFFAMLQGLMGRPSSLSGINVPGFPSILGGAGASVQLPIGELIPSLTRIQHGDVSGMVDGNMALAATVIEPGITNVLRQLKGSSLASGLGQTEGMTLDIVIMLFDQIFDDSKITSAMKGLIGRLQIPVLKVAILDKTFFSKKTHPARKLLNVMGELAISLPEDFGSSSPLYVELDRIVQRLIDTFQDNLDVFDELRQELERVSAQEANRSIEGARHLAAAVEQRERLGMAHAVAQHAIRLRVESRKLPQVVVRFLAEQWVKLLIVAYAKHGAESDAYKTATTTMDLLIWSVSPMQSLEERRKLAARLPGLLKRLDYGLQLIGASEEVRKHFFAKLMRCHTKIINSPTDQTSVASSHPSTAHSSTPMHGGHDNSESAIESAAHAPVASLPVLTEVAESSAPIAANTPAHAPSREAVSQPSAAEAASSEPPDDTEPQESSATFSAVTIPNPFGEGEIEVEEIDLADLPGNNSADLPTTAPSNPAASDENSRMVSGLQEGAWVEFRDREDNITIARLSYISPLKGTYLFVNRKGRKVGEYSLYQLAREFRSGTAALMDSSPLFDRAMTNVVGALKKTAP